MLLLVIGFLLIGTVSNFSSAVGRTPQPPVCANLLQDPGFEDYTPNPYWEEFSINVDTPLCSAAVCGTGFVGPRNGIIWAWFTRGTVDDYAYLSQSVTIPEGIATLTFYLAIGPAAGAGADDVFFVDIDGFDVFVTDATETASYIGYQLVTVDVSSFADGNLHDLTLTADTYWASPQLMDI